MQHYFRTYVVIMWANTINTLNKPLYTKGFSFCIQVALKLLKSFHTVIRVK